ncbi:alpha/beta hydrolase [Streptomyces sp. SPB162]|uniref:alpha/beta hydrolase family protein n=1 Tax=Streptomyces sp. SPB162 TaxID=2940560 RepID=UPI002405D4B4|nr:alpha/beta hydrolase [Streptomyces sp. SPB162]
MILWQNTFDVDEHRVTIRQDGRTLSGVLSTPRDGRARHGLVVFVHGDGPIDATHEGGYDPMWEAYTRSGYAPLPWDKPGVGDTPGDWLGQSMDDRADEAVAAIAWARSRPEVDTARVGLWGASQAGWVLPKIAARTPVAFVIALSPAINWLRQGRFNLLAELHAENASPARVQRETAGSDTTRRLLEQRATFEQYVRILGDQDGMTAGRWGFIARNYTADTTADLRALRGIPVMLALAGRDINVDTTDTESVYRAVLAPTGQLAVRRYTDANHSLAKRSLEGSELKITFTALFAPRSLFADGFLDDQRRFLRDLRGNAAPQGS